MPERPLGREPLDAAGGGGDAGVRRPLGGGGSDVPLGAVVRASRRARGRRHAIADNHGGGGAGFGEGTREAAAVVKEPLGCGGQGLRERVGWGKEIGFGERAWVPVGLGSMWEFCALPTTLPSAQKLPSGACSFPVVKPHSLSQRRGYIWEECTGTAATQGRMRIWE